MKFYELIPTNGRKSFYGKALVYCDEHGNETLTSYNVPIVKRTYDGKLFRLWNGWSQTTGNHIKSFCGLTKAEFFNLPRATEITPLEKAQAYSGMLYI